MNKSTYQKMAGKFLSWFGPSGFWVGDDHFLYTQGFIIEEYRRFYFEDVQAIIVQPSIARNLQAFVYALLAGVSAFPLFYYSGPGRWYALVPVLLFVVLLVINFAKGPTCSFRLITAVSDCRVRTFSRVSAARRYRPELLRSIENAQGPMTAVAVRDEAVPDAPLRPVRHEDGGFHILSLVCMLAMAVLSLFLMVEPKGLFVGLTGAVILVSLVASVGALIRQRNSDMPPALRAWTWGVFGNFLIDLTLAYMGFVFAFVTFSETGGLSLAGAWFQNIHLHPISGGILNHIYFFFFLFSGLLGASGLVLILRYAGGGGHARRAAAAGPNPDPGGAP